MDWGSAVASIFNLGSSIANTFSTENIARGQQYLLKAQKVIAQSQADRLNWMQSVLPYLVLLGAAPIIIILAVASVSRK